MPLRHEIDSMTQRVGSVICSYLVKATTSFAYTLGVPLAARFMGVL